MIFCKKNHKLDSAKVKYGMQVVVISGFYEGLEGYLSGMGHSYESPSTKYYVTCIDPKTDTPMSIFEDKDNLMLIKERNNG